MPFRGGEHTPAFRSRCGAECILRGLEPNPLFECNGVAVVLVGSFVRDDVVAANAEAVACGAAWYGQNDVRRRSFW